MDIRPRVYGIGSTTELQALVAGLALANLAQMRAGRFPSIYKSGVRYRREQPGEERWQTARALLRSGFGDCEDLAAYHVAWLWCRGERSARAIVRDIRPGLKHALVRRASGQLEDPSARLGMRGNG